MGRRQEKRRDGNGFPCAPLFSRSQYCSTIEGAHNRLGISTGDMTPTGEMNGDPVYRYKLKTISFEGITINNPEVIIHSDRVRHKTSQSPEIGTRLI